MLTVLRNSWALLLGMLLLMLGNGMQGTLLGIRGGIEEFSTLEMSVVMSCYFLGFLFGSRMAPEMIRRVGHVRVFAALGSMISAVLIMYAVAPNWIAISAKSGETRNRTSRLNMPPRKEYTIPMPRAFPASPRAAIG